MKIKKKEYQQQLDDRYWEGVKAGMRFAIDHPEEAKRQINHIEVMRSTVEKMSKAFQPLVDAIHKLYGGEK